MRLMRVELITCNFVIVQQAPSSDCGGLSLLMPVKFLEYRGMAVTRALI